MVLLKFDGERASGWKGRAGGWFLHFCIFANGWKGWWQKGWFLHVSLTEIKLANIMAVCYAWVFWDPCIAWGGCILCRPRALHDNKETSFHCSASFCETNSLLSEGIAHVTRYVFGIISRNPMNDYQSVSHQMEENYPKYLLTSDVA